MTSLFDEKIKAFLEEAAAVKERLALQMLLDGKYPQDGWSIAESIYTEGMKIKYECGAIKR